MKEATGEVSMTLVTIVAIGVIGTILALFWQPITNWINERFNSAMGNTAQGTPTLPGGSSGGSSGGGI